MANVPLERRSDVDILEGLAGDCGFRDAQARRTEAWGRSEGSFAQWLNEGVARQTAIDVSQVSTAGPAASDSWMSPCGFPPLNRGADGPNT